VAYAMWWVSLLAGLLQLLSLLLHRVLFFSLGGAFSSLLSRYFSMLLAASCVMR
jgi:hypothetical protein